MLTTLCSWQHLAQWPQLSRRRPSHFFHLSSEVHGNNRKHRRLLKDICAQYLLKFSCGIACMVSDVCRHLLITGQKLEN